MFKGKYKYEDLIGALFFVPIYLLFFIFRIGIGGKELLFGLIRYLPIIIGFIILYMFYKKKANKNVITIFVVFELVSIVLFAEAFIFNKSSLAGSIFFLLWLLCDTICKSLLCVVYSKLVGWRRSLIMFSIYVVFALLFVYYFWQ